MKPLGDTEVANADDSLESRRGMQLSEVASRGGLAVVAKYGPEYMSSLGKRGSRALIKKYGLRYYSEIAARNKGVKKRRPGDTPA